MNRATAMASIALAGLIASTSATGAVVPELVELLTRGIQKGLQTSSNEARKELETSPAERLAAGLEKWLEGVSLHDIVAGQVDSFEAAMVKLVIAKGASDLMIGKLEPTQQREIRAYLSPRLRAAIAQEVARRARELCRPDAFGQHLVGDTREQVEKLLLRAVVLGALTLAAPEVRAAQMAEAIASRLTVVIVEKAAKAAVEMVRKGASRKDFCKLLGDAMLDLPDEAMEQALDEVLPKTHRSGLVRVLDWLRLQLRWPAAA